MDARNLHLLLEIPSHLDQLDLVDAVLETTLRGLMTDGESADRVALAAREAVVNAIRHGNQEDPAKKVKVTVAEENNRLLIRVRDEGGGFDPDQVPDPLAPENLLRPHGRGILLMRTLTEAVEFEFDPAGGTVVTLRAPRQPSPPAEENEEAGP